MCNDLHQPKDVTPHTCGLWFEPFVDQNSASKEHGQKISPRCDCIPYLWVASHTTYQSKWPGFNYLYLLRYFHEHLRVI